MIPFDFIYCRPDSLREAAEVFSQLQNEGKKALYYAGGSEIITMCRTGAIVPDAVIDIKGIPDCNTLETDGNMLYIGAACTLNLIKNAMAFPLFGLACGRIADHTNQCRITLGGNLCGTILYRETSLPLLLSDAEAILFCGGKSRSTPFSGIWHERLQLEPGELLMGVRVPFWATRARHWHIKKTAGEKIDYPLISIAALEIEERLRIAFSGICTFPFRSAAIETALNECGVSSEIKARQAIELLPQALLEDARGTGAYRAFILENTLSELLEEVKHGKV